MQILILDTQDNFTMPPAKSSEVWDHFTIMGNNTVNCRFCSLSLSYNPRGGTGNLVRHMKRKHRHITLNLKNKKSEMKSPIIERITTSSTNLTTNTNLCANPDESILPTSKGVMSSPTSQKLNVVHLSKTPRKPKEVSKKLNVIKNPPTNPEPLTVHRSSEIDYQLLKMIVKEYHSFQIVEDPEFRNLIYLLCPTYKIPTIETLSCNLLPAIHEKLKIQMQALIKSDVLACLTVDRWTSHNNQNHFYAITSHFIDANTTLQKVFLDCIQYQDQHTADNISQTLNDVVSQWGLEQNIIAVVTDDDDNILDAAKNLKWKQVNCMAHFLNMAINKGLEQQKITSIIIKVKTIIEYFEQNSEALLILEDNKKQLNLPVLKLKQDTVAYWNSTHDMLVRFHTLKDAIITTLAVENPLLNFFSVEDWEIISKCIDVLQLFQILTESLCSEEHIFLSKVPIYVSSILDNLNEQITEQDIACIKELCNIIKEEIHSRFGNVETEELFAQATLLDPRIKSNGLSSENAEKTIADLKQLCAKVKINIDQNHQDVNKNNEESHLHPNKSQLLWGKFDKKVKHLFTPQNSIATSSIEIDKYLDEVLLDRNEDPLMWWKQRKDIYPRLYKVMLKRLCITATCVPCAKIFSEVGQLINERRSRLKPEDFFSIAFLAHNLK